MKSKLTIKGTHCGACKSLIEDVSLRIQGVKACSVDFQTGKTEIEHDRTMNLDIFKKAIEGLGSYKIEI